MLSFGYQNVSQQSHVELGQVYEQTMVLTTVYATFKENTLILQKGLLKRKHSSIGKNWDIARLKSSQCH